LQKTRLIEWTSMVEMTGMTEMRGMRGLYTMEEKVGGMKEK